jgi:PAS domain S-box-containing protein
MRDNKKTKAELLKEVETLSRHLAKLSQSEQELRESEQKWRSLLSNTPDIIMIVDRDGTMQFINHTVPGIKEQEATGKKVYDYISPEYHDTMRKNLERVFQTGQITGQEIVGVGPHGSLSWYQANLGPIRKKGHVIAASIITRDITEHKEREKELEDSEEKYRTLSGNIPGMIYRAKADWSAEFFSHSETVCGGYLIEDLKSGKIKWLDIIHPDDKQRVFDEGSELARKPGTLTQEYRILANDGSVRWVEDHKTSTFTKEGKLVGVDGVVFDITKRRLAEKALQLRNVAIESSINGVAFVDLEGNLFYANDSFLKMWGYNDEKQVLGKPAMGFWADVSKAAEIRKVVKNKGGWTGELVAKRKDGSTFDVELSASLVKDENDNPVCSMASFVDITERKNTEQSLRESEERLRVALSAAQMGTWWWNPATNQDTRDASLNAILGFKAVESTQPVDDFLQCVHPEDRDMVDAEIQRAVREHRTYLAEFRIVRPDGTVRWLRDQGKLLYGENDNLLYMTGAVVDITGRKQAEDALRESEKRFRDIFENTAVGVYRTTPDGKILMANPALVQMLGYSSFERLSRRNLEEEGFEPQYQRSIFKEEIERMGQIVGSESIWITQDGKRLYVLENARVVRDKDGKILYYEGTVENITKAKQAEEELDEYREKMAHAERLASVGTLSAIMAHTLNNPLTAIQLSIQNAMAESKKTPRQSAITKYLKDSLRSISEVSSTVRSLGKFASESSKEIISEVNLKAVAERTVKLLSESARRAKMRLHLEGMDQLPPIYSNEKDLEQLFFSLVENAIQAADGNESHRLIISGAVKDQHIELRFNDDCCGIEPENLNKIFEPFFTTNPPGEGTGLGLCIVDRFVSEAGGNIRVESEAGKGSTFFVTLPISRGRRY